MYYLLVVGLIGWIMLYITIPGIVARLDLYQPIFLRFFSILYLENLQEQCNMLRNFRGVSTSYPCQKLCPQTGMKRWYLSYKFMKRPIKARFLTNSSLCHCYIDTIRVRAQDRWSHCTRLCKDGTLLCWKNNWPQLRSLSHWKKKNICSVLLGGWKLNWADFIVSYSYLIVSFRWCMCVRG